MKLNNTQERVVESFEALQKKNSQQIDECNVQKTNNEIHNIAT